MKSKYRILTCSDAHFSSTGFGKYTKEVLTRLAKTGKYELAELACYGLIESTNLQNKGWRYYPNHVSNKHPKYKEFKSDNINQLGKWRWEKTVLDFRPHIVWDIRDPWFHEYIIYSPLKQFYHLALMPTVDSYPQKTFWLDSFRLCDSLLVYSEWAKPILEEHQLKVSGIASPGIDTEVFKPMNKVEQRKRFGLSPDINIVGTIMRNQVRKLFPDLCHVAKMVIDENPNTFFFFHTGYPDNGWNLPELLLEFNIAHNVLFTYKCSKCKDVSVKLYSGQSTICQNCGGCTRISNSAHQNGVEDTDLAKIINCFDLYIQYSITEGFGMPQVEAASCGVPIASVDYSAMADIVRNVGGFPLKPQRMFRELGTNAYRALPNNEETSKCILDFLRLDKEDKNMYSFIARESVLNRYTWDQCAKTWENHFDSIVLDEIHGKYDGPSKIKPKTFSMPNLNGNDFIDWLILEVMDEPMLLNSYKALNMNYELYNKRRFIGKDYTVITKENLLEEAINYRNFKQQIDMIRTGQVNIKKEDFIEFAHAQEKDFNQ